MRSVKLIAVLIPLLLLIGCAKPTAKKPSLDDSANVKLTTPAPTAPAPAAGDKKGDKGAKADEPNWLNDPRFKKDPPTTLLPPDGSSPNKQPWGLPAPQGGWQGPNAGVPPVQPAGPGGMPMPGIPVPGAPGGVPAPGPGPVAPAAPGVPAPPGMGMLQPQPMAPPAPGATPAVPLKRVEVADMKEVWIFIENASGASGKMPSQLLTYQALLKAESPAADLVKSGSIYLTGATTRESIWAFETQALTQGGLVCSQNGVETLTAAELKARLGK